MIPTCVLLFAYASALAKLTPQLPHRASQYLFDWPTGVGALGIIYLAATHLTVKRTLGHYIPRYLGHISYSLYLVHDIVLVALMTVLYRRLSMYAIFFAYLVLALALAALFNRMVEVPAMNLGRRLTRSKSMPERITAAV